MSRIRGLQGGMALLALTTVFVSVTAGAANAAPTVSSCKITISGAPWKIAGSRSGSTYTLAARGMPCASARSWVVRFTHQTSSAAGAVMKGPAGFSCRSMSTSASGDKLVYSGVCTKGVHNLPFFEWGPKP